MFKLFKKFFSGSVKEKKDENIVVKGTKQIIMAAFFGCCLSFALVFLTVSIVTIIVIRILGIFS